MFLGCREATEGVSFIITEPPTASRRECIHAFRRTHPDAERINPFPTGGGRTVFFLPGLIITGTPTVSRRGRRPRLPGYRVSYSPRPRRNGNPPPPGSRGRLPLRGERTVFFLPGLIIIGTPTASRRECIHAFRMTYPDAERINPFPTALRTASFSPGLCYNRNAHRLS